MPPPPHQSCPFHRWELVHRSATWRIFRCADCASERDVPVNRTREINWRPRRVQPDIRELFDE